jgi:hypothetical protein
LLVPYSARPIVTSFRDAAESGATWEEALADLGETFGLTGFGGPINARAARILRQCKKQFQWAKMKYARMLQQKDKHDRIL